MSSGPVTSGPVIVVLILVIQECNRPSWLIIPSVLPKNFVNF